MRSTRWLVAGDDNFRHAAIDETDTGPRCVSKCSATICAIVKPASFMTASVSSAERRWMWLIISSIRRASFAGRGPREVRTRVAMPQLVPGFELIDACALVKAAVCEET